MKAWSFIGMMVFALSTRADEPWAIEFGVEAKSLIASPMLQKLKVKLGKDYDDLMNQPMQKAGFRLDQIVRLSGGCPTISNIDHIDRSLVMVIELGSADETATMIQKLGIKTSFPAGFLPAYPTAVGYKTPEGNNVLAIDGPRIAVTQLLDESPNFKLLTAAMMNHGTVGKTMAAAKSHQYLRVDGSMMNMLKQMPLPPQADSFKPLLDSTGYTWHLSLTDKLAFELKGTFVNEKDAEGAKEAVEQLLALAGVGLNYMKGEMEKDKEIGQELKPVFDMVQALRKGAKPKIEGTTLVVKTDATFPDNVVELVLQSTKKVREAASRSQSQNNLKMIGLAQHNYESTYQHFANNIASKENPPKELLSWRVAILPYVEQEALNRQFKADEPWDSKANKKLLTQMPKIFVHPNANPKDTAAGKTHYRVFRSVGPETPESGAFLPFKPNEKLRILSITDGMSNTIMIVEAAEAVEWTKSEALVLDPAKPLPKLGGLTKGGFNVVMCDGSLRFIKDTIDEKTLKAMLTRAGGEVASFDP